MKRILPFALLLVALGAVGPAPARATVLGPPGIFIVKCKFAQERQVDPIVAPGVATSAHDHIFFGAVGITQDTTATDLLADPTTCGDTADHSGYWQPTVIAPDGSTVTAASVAAYYRRDRGDGNVIATPAGLKALNARFSYTCGKASPTTSTPQSCVPYGSGAYLHLSVNFANCWDGVNLDTINPDGSPATNPVTGAVYPNDHRSHLAFSYLGVCPDGYPAKIPRLTFHVLYPSVTDPTAGYSLSSDMNAGSAPLMSLHGDFFNGWDQTRLQHLVDVCLNAGVSCGNAAKVK